MVIGQGASCCKCDAIHATPTIQSPAVVIQRVMNVVMPLRAPECG